MCHLALDEGQIFVEHLLPEQERTIDNEERRDVSARVKTFGHWLWKDIADFVTRMSLKAN